MRIGRLITTVFVFAACGFSQAAHAGVIVDQRGYPYGGQVTDTEFSTFGETEWCELADDVFLSSPATVRQVRWLGFYGGIDEGPWYPPTGPETMRVRFYVARPGDQLPGDIIYEEFFSDAHRTWTGGYVNDAGPRPEFSYWVNLSQELSLIAGTRYWLSVSQVGIPNSWFRWEFSDDGNGHQYAGRWTYGPEWEYSGLVSEQAFSLLSIPEPATALLLASFLLVTHHRRSKWKGVKTHKLSG